MTGLTLFDTNIAGEPVTANPLPVTPGVKRIRSQELFAQMREVEIDHDGRIYRLRLTRLNKLLLTA